ncbi:MAG: 3-deoxy-8-phosphooctulonate synthase [Planctomycetota bacterium]|jgi:2-dehydro-3-deoxyphosphooctonate aldolase (KDO 8-P synthase)
MTRSCTIGPIEIGAGQLVVIAGPCLAEDQDLCLTIGRTMVEVCGELGIGYVFKASFDKANRTSAASPRGPGLERGLEYLQAVREELKVPVLTDLHTPDQAAAVGAVVDSLQIPAFLCRQTDLLVAAAQTGKNVNIKKGQFMAPWDMGPAVEKVRAAGNDNVLLTERGTSFGYNRLITDFRSIPQMQAFAPVAFDVTHSIQEPAGQGNASGGQREFAPLLANAAMACGADALFVETHPAPEQALSDAACQLPLTEMATVLGQCKLLFEAARG